MTSSNGNIFRVTGPLWGESTGPQLALTLSLICAWTNGWTTIEMPMIWDAIALIMTSLQWISTHLPLMSALFIVASSSGSLRLCSISSSAARVSASNPELFRRPRNVRLDNWTLPALNSESHVLSRLLVAIDDFREKSNGKGMELPDPEVAADTFRDDSAVADGRSCSLSSGSDETILPVVVVWWLDEEGFSMLSVCGKREHK